LGFGFGAQVVRLLLFAASVRRCGLVHEQRQFFFAPALELFQGFDRSGGAAAG
jgi:hypothetical protein